MKPKDVLGPIILSALITAIMIPHASAKKVTITYWHGWTAEWETEINRIVKQFNNTHPDITVKPLVIGNQSVTQKLVTSMAAGIVPDVVTIWDNSIASLADKNLLTPLDAYMNAEGKRLNNWFYPYALQLGQYGSKTWALPSSLNAQALYYNKRLFAEAGIGSDNPPKTIEELDLHAAKMTVLGTNGSYTRMGFFPDNFYQWGHQFGGRFWDGGKNKVTFTDPPIVKALEWMGNYRRKYESKPVDKFLGSLSGERAGTKDPFVSGRYAMQLQGQWKVGDIKKFSKDDFTYGVAPLPSVVGGPYGSCILNGNMQVIPRGSKNAKAAWEFVKFWSGINNEDYAAQMMNIGDRPVWVPVSPTVYRNATYQKYVRTYPASKVFVDIAADDNSEPVYLMPGQETFFAQMGEAEYSGSRGVRSPLEALNRGQQQAQKEIDRQLQRLKSRK